MIALGTPIALSSRQLAQSARQIRERRKDMIRGILCKKRSLVEEPRSCCSGVFIFYPALASKKGAERKDGSRNVLLPPHKKPAQWRRSWSAMTTPKMKKDFLNTDHQSVNLVISSELLDLSRELLDPDSSGAQIWGAKLDKLGACSSRAFSS